MKQPACARFPVYIKIPLSSSNHNNAPRVHAPPVHPLRLRDRQHRGPGPALPVPPDVPDHGGQAGERALAPNAVLGPPLLLQDAPALGPLLPGREQRARGGLHARPPPAHAAVPPAPGRARWLGGLLFLPFGVLAVPVPRGLPLPVRPVVARFHERVGEALARLRRRALQERVRSARVYRASSRTRPRERAFIVRLQGRMRSACLCSI